MERDGPEEGIGAPRRDRGYQEVYRAILSRRAGLYLGIDGVWLETRNTYSVGEREKCSGRGKGEKP